MPRNQLKPYTRHMASKVAPNGDVSALCFVKPRAINYLRSTWTSREDAVTCRKCKAILAYRRSGLRT